MNTVLLEKHPGFAIVTLNRPEAMNALSRELRRDFVQVFKACAEDPDIRVVILTGAGKAFCAGFDLKELGASDAVMARYKPCSPAAIAAVVAWLAENDPPPTWEPLHILHGPAIAKELGLLQSPSLLDA